MSILMRFERFFTGIVLMLFFVSTSYGIGLYNEDGQFVYYTKNPSPTVEISITSPNQPVFVEKATLEINAQLKPEFLISESLEPLQNKTYTFPVSNFDVNSLSSNDSVFFKLHIVDSLGEPISVTGDPNEFWIEADTSSPQMLFPQINGTVIMTFNDRNYEFLFDERLRAFEVYLNGELVRGDYNLNISENQYKDRFLYEFEHEMLKGGRNTAKIVYEDLAGNIGELEFQINYAGGPLLLNMLTHADNNTLDYHYNINYSGLFDKTIFSSSNNYEMVLETNKESTCYLSYTLLGWDSINNVIEKQAFTTSDNFTHSFNVDVALMNKVWIACQNNVFEEEVIYLNNELGIQNDLINLEVYLGSPISIISTLPVGVQTSVPFNFEVQTNERAICMIKLGSGVFEEMTTTDYINHNMNSVTLNNGNYDIEYVCLDVLYHNATSKTSLEIDTGQGVSIISYEPKFAVSDPVDINILFSEAANCRYSTELVGIQNFFSLPELTGTSQEKSFTASGLVEGENKFYIYCSKGNNANYNEIVINYDSTGIILSNLVFVNNGIESDYIGDPDEIDFEFDVDSSVPIETYYVKVYDGADVIFEDEVGSNEVSINGNFRNATLVTVQAEDELGRLSNTLEKAIQIDLAPPQVTPQIGGSSFTIACFDAESGCYEIEYGVSDVSFSCNPTIKYEAGDLIESGDYSYVCARAQDYVGNDAMSEILELNGEFNVIDNFTNETGGGTAGDFGEPVNDTDDFGNDDFEDNLTDDFDNEDGGNDDFDNEDNDDAPVDPFFPEDGDGGDDGSGGGINYLLIVALVLVIAGIGGGGYYAYKKGYLDEQLHKMGVDRKGSKYDKSANDFKPSVQTQIPTTTTRPVNNTPVQRSLSRDNYDEHLKKLNKFVDETINKKSDVFSNFGSMDKGKVEDYDDTLIKKPKIRDISKEEFDDFYTKSTNLSGDLSEEKSLEKEAEDFEDFYKKKSDNKTNSVDKDNLLNEDDLKTEDLKNGNEENSKSVDKKESNKK